MLADKNVMATVAVKDLARAKTFYSVTLGLPLIGTESEEVLTFRSGSCTLVVYRSQFAGTNKATSATWGCGNELDAIAAALKIRGVVFEHYDMPGMERKGDVHVMGSFKAVWFRDPEGNILHINNG